MNWQNIETAPKDGKEILVCNIRQGSITQLVRWDKIHGYWVSKGKPDLHFQWTHWTPIFNKPTPPSPQTEGGRG